MKLRHAAALALLLLASCTLTVQESTARAEAAAARAELAATRAERAADQALNVSVQASKTADEAERDVRRANASINRLEAPHMPYCELLLKPTRRLRPYWCLMGPPVIGGFDSESIDWYAPRSRFCVSNIFDTERECHDSLRDSPRFYQKERRDYRAHHPHEKYVAFRVFCAPCANGNDHDD